MGRWGEIIATMVLLVPAATAGAQAAPSACPLEPIGSGRVAMVTDGRTFVLDDGREFRLAGIEAPYPPFAGQTGDREGSAARASLEALIAGDAVTLFRHGPETADRYGRILAHARTVAGQDAARTMLAEGHARVAAHAEDRACTAELLAVERAAREAKLGLWGEQDYAVLGAEDGAGLLAGRGRFTVVEGKVLSVRESGGTIYMNFGKRWSEALTVTIPKRQERTFAAAGIRVKQLENRRLRVRGWIEERSGPRIEAVRPEQIEIAERQ